MDKGRGGEGRGWMKEGEGGWMKGGGMNEGRGGGG